MEVNEACSIIEDSAHEDANIIFGSVINEECGDEIHVTVIATGFPTDHELNKPYSKKSASVCSKQSKSNEYYSGSSYADCSCIQPVQKFRHLLLIQQAAHCGTGSGNIYTP